MIDFNQDMLSTLEDKNVLAWLFLNDIKTERGYSFDFEKFSFMIQPWLDWTPQQAARKASQCGWSVMTNCKLFYAAKFGIPGYSLPAANVIYTLPADKDVNDFVPSKTNMLIKQNKVLQQYVLDENGNSRYGADSVTRKRVGDSMVYFKGTRSKTAALMITSDLNIHDESDRSEPTIIDEYSSRVATSIYKGRWVFSNPSAPGMPADLLYLESDQKHWFIRCEHCNHWQYLSWHKLSENDFTLSHHTFVDDKNGLYVCGKCARPISDEVRKRGRWIAKFPKRDISGYWVSHMMYSWLSAKDLLKTEADKSRGYFMNFVLGLPYVGSDVTVDASTIVNNIQLDEWKPVRGQVALGVDNGDIKHWVLGDVKGVRAVGKTKSWDDIERLIQKYDPITVIDLNPYPNKPRELAKKYRRVYASFYVENTKTLDLVQWGQGEKKFMVYPDRDKALDDMMEYMFNGNMKFFNAKAYWEEYISHFETMYRADMVNGQIVSGELSAEMSKKAKKGVWLSSNGTDHFVHATLYYYVALARLIGGGGKLLSGRNNLESALKEVSGGKILSAPITHPERQTITPSRSFIPNLSGLNSGNKGRGGAASGNM